MPADPHQIETSRLALVGATSLLGREVKDQLAASGVAGDAITLFDLEEVAGVLTEYGKEARVLAETVLEDVLRHGLICFCGDSTVAGENLDAIRAARKPAIDCTGAWIDTPDAFTWIPGASAPPRIGDHRMVVIPSAASLMLGTMLNALGNAAERGAATIFVPASDLGEAGLRELSQQSMAVLNLGELDVTVFGRQSAFDLWPIVDKGRGDNKGYESADALASRLARLDVPVPALQLVSVPVFHGMSMSLFVPDVDVDEVTRRLLESGISTEAGDHGSIDSPVRATGTAGLHAVDVRPHRHGVWLWITIDNLHARAAAAVTAILTMSGTELNDAPQ